MQVVAENLKLLIQLLIFEKDVKINAIICTLEL